mgnify:CR=1 FL=1
MVDKNTTNISLTPELRNRLVAGVRRLCGECTIYLFGSYAVGTAGPSSDLDIAVIVDKVGSKIDMAAQLWKELSDIPLPKDIVVTTSEEFRFYRNEPGSVYRTIADKGQLLYGQAPPDPRGQWGSAIAGATVALWS